MISVQQQTLDNDFRHFSISNVRFAFWAFFRKPEKLGSHTGSNWWPGDPDVKDDPNDPVTQFRVCYRSTYSRWASGTRPQWRRSSLLIRSSTSHEWYIPKPANNLRQLCPVRSTLFYAIDQSINHLFKSGDMAQQTHTHTHTQTIQQTLIRITRGKQKRS